MTADVETKEVQKQVKSPIALVEGKGLVPKDFEGLWRVSGIIASSGLAPKDMHENPAAIFVACQMGFEVGMSIMASIQNIAVINGRPSIWGDSVLGLVRASGVLKSFKETSRGTFPEDDYTAVCEVHREGDETPTVREFSILDAKTAQLWQYPAKGVTPWHKYPKRMLQMRARSWALRDTFGDILKGIHVAEEAMDFDVDMAPNTNGTYRAVNTDEPSYPEPNAKTDDELIDQFEEEFAKRFSDDDVGDMSEFCTMIGESNGGLTIVQVKAETVRDGEIDGFFDEFEKYRSGMKKAATQGGATDDKSSTGGAGDRPSGGETGEDQTIDWDPVIQPIQQRYSKDQKAALQLTADEMGISTKGLKPSEVHQAIAQAAQGDFEDEKLKPTEQKADDSGSSDDEENTQDLIETMNEANELWISAPKECRNYAGEKAGCEPTVNGFKRFTADNVSVWLEAAKKWQAENK